MRIMPFMKRKKGIQFAGIGLDTGGGGGGVNIPIATSESLGGVIVADGVTVDSDGHISVNGYSENETEVGYVIENGVRKKLFRKSLVAPGTNYNDYPTIPNVSEVYRFNAILKRDTAFYPIPYVGSSGSYFYISPYKLTSDATNTLQFSTNGSFSGTGITVRLTVDYTKTN